jgi:hypothetical protein
MAMGGHFPPEYPRCEVFGGGIGLPAEGCRELLKSASGGNH